MCEAHKKNRAKLKLLAIFLIPLILIIQTFSALAYSDVPEGDPYYTAISYLTEKGMIKGYDDGTYKPNQWINRAETLKILILASGIATEEEILQMEAKTMRPFTDTPLDAWYINYLVKALTAGIINGYPDGSFKPSNDINLAETLKIFFEALADDIDYSRTEEFLFDDTPLTEWFTKYTASAASKGIINIYASNTVNPSQIVSRGYLAEIIYRYMKSIEGYEFGKATWYGAAVQGNGTASGEIFDKDQFTAAHKYLPFGAIIEVTNLTNGKTVEVKINDRGPYGHGRVLDLSSGAFSQIADLGSGIIDVQYKPIHIP